MTTEPLTPETPSGTLAVEKVEALAGWSHIDEWRDELVALIRQAEAEAREQGRREAYDAEFERRLAEALNLVEHPAVEPSTIVNAETGLTMHDCDMDKAHAIAERLRQPT